MSNIINENPVYSGLVKMNTISPDTLGGKPSGWYVREKYDKETGKSIVLEFGIYLTETIFLSIPIHFSMKNMFVRANIQDPEYNYYQVPNNVQFGVATYTNKKTGMMNPILVSPSEKHPPVFISAFAYSPKTIILGVDIDSPKTYVLKRYFDKERTVLGFIAFTLLTDTSKITCTIREGVLGGVSQDVHNIEFTSNGCSTDSDVVTTDKKNATEFIKLPMFVVNPPKEEATNENVSSPTENDIKDKSSGEEAPQKKPFNGNKDPYRPYRPKKKYADNPNSSEYHDYKRDRYNRKKGNNGKHSHNDDEHAN